MADLYEPLGNIYVDGPPKATKNRQAPEPRDKCAEATPGISPACDHGADKHYEWNKKEQERRAKRREEENALSSPQKREKGKQLPEDPLSELQKNELDYKDGSNKKKKAQSPVFKDDFFAIPKQKDGAVPVKAKKARSSRADNAIGIAKQLDDAAPAKVKKARSSSKDAVNAIPHKGGAVPIDSPIGVLPGKATPTIASKQPTASLRMLPVTPDVAAKMSVARLEKPPPAQKRPNLSPPFVDDPENDQKRQRGQRLRQKEHTIRKADIASLMEYSSESEKKTRHGRQGKEDFDAKDFGMEIKQEIDRLESNLERYDKVQQLRSKQKRLKTVAYICSTLIVALGVVFTVSGLVVIFLDLHIEGVEDI
ncbi:hypothetical protein QR680_004978 [Steinernema hermaphroditum]|uniref:Uncharacterized protein n=1 Tax=Steinernema hermaphroditum TaxID=289476 RepID=A0AA39HQF8_9BILA|nr:hypothetical protein QR680_004978 [Steinernema hermaphroditum]